MIHVGSNQFLGTHAGALTILSATLLIKSTAEVRPSNVIIVSIYSVYLRNNRSELKRSSLISPPCKSDC